MFNNPEFYIFAVPIIFLIAFIKGGFGGGFTILGIPIFSIFMPAIEATAILGLLVCLMDISAIAAYKPSVRNWDKKNLTIMLPGLLCGVLFGIVYFKYLDVRYIIFLIGFMSIVVAIQWLFTHNKQTKPQGYNSYKGAFCGMLSGFSSFVAQAGGSPIAYYLIPQRLDKIKYVTTTIIFFAIGNFVKLIGYIWLQLLTLESLIITSILSPVIFLGIYSGRKFNAIINQQTLYLGCYSLVLITGAKLLYDSLILF